MVKEEKEQPTPESSPQKSGVNAQETGNENRVSRSPEPAPLPGSAGPLGASRVPSSPPSQLNVDSLEDSLKSIAHKDRSSPVGSPKHTSYKVIQSPKGTIISSLEVPEVLRAQDTEKVCEESRQLRTFHFFKLMISTNH